MLPGPHQGGLQRVAPFVHPQPAQAKGRQRLPFGIPAGRRLTVGDLGAIAVPGVGEQRVTDRLSQQIQVPGDVRC